MLRGTSPDRPQPECILPEPIVARMPGHQQVRCGDKLHFKANRAELHLRDPDGNNCRLIHPGG